MRCKVQHDDKPIATQKFSLLYLKLTELRLSTTGYIVWLLATQSWNQAWILRQSQYQVWAGGNLFTTWICYNCQRCRSSYTVLCLYLFREFIVFFIIIIISIILSTCSESHTTLVMTKQIDLHQAPSLDRCPALSPERKCLVFAAVFSSSLYGENLRIKDMFGRSMPGILS